MKNQKPVLFGFVTLAIAGAALAQAIPNWPAPATWTPSKGMVASAQADVTNPVPFIPATPCRVADTRGNGFTGAYGPPALAASGTRNFTIAGQCGIPAAAVAVSFNFTITNGTAAGDLRFYPAGGAVPTVSTINWSAGQAPLANAAVVPLSTGGAISVKNDSTGTVQLIIDINGYYSPTPANAGNYLQIINNSGTWTIEGVNQSTTCTGVCGIVGETASGTAVWGDSLNSDGVLGTSNGSGLGMAGVYGTSSAAIGTFGHSDNLNGVWAESTNLDGLAAFGGRDGTYSQGARYGVYAVSAGTTGGLDGVLGVTNDTTLGHDAAGVKGVVTGLDVTGTGVNNAGVRGEASTAGDGVVGATVTGYGTVGYVFSAASGGAFQAGGALGVNSTTGVYCWGNFGATGTKSFIEPHPTEAGKVIDYVALEGPEAGTYFRGKGHISGGRAVIQVPDSFRMVTDPDGLTVQVTPIGRSVTVSVVSYDLNAIVVEANEDVDFFYLVNGVRAAFKDHQVIRDDNKEFVPQSANDKLPMYLPASLRQRLIDNGTYNEDGTVNMDTAQRMGWVDQWQARAAQVKAQAEAAAAKQAADHVPANSGQETQQP